MHHVSHNYSYPDFINSGNCFINESPALKRRLWLYTSGMSSKCHRDLKDLKKKGQTDRQRKEES
jgi:hypothetical protein